MVRKCLRGQQHLCFTVWSNISFGLCQGYFRAERARVTFQGAHWPGKPGNLELSGNFEKIKRSGSSCFRTDILLFGKKRETRVRETTLHLKIELFCTGFFEKWSWKTWNHQGISFHKMSGHPAFPCMRLSKCSIYSKLCFPLGLPSEVQLIHKLIFQPSIQMSNPSDLIFIHPTLGTLSNMTRSWGGGGGEWQDVYLHRIVLHESLTLPEWKFLEWPPPPHDRVLLLKLSNISIC